MKPATFTARVDSIVTRATLPSPVHVWEDASDKRLKIQFQLEPDPDAKKLLRKYGFMFRAGSTQAWCRKLDDNGRRAARAVLAILTERTPEDNA